MLTVEPTYVAGEETAAVRVLNGGPAKPTDKPPRPFEEGVAGLPTLVSNVETLANLPFVHRHGGRAFREHGTSTSPGTFLATITGAGRPPVLYEIPHGVAFTDLLTMHGVPADQVRGVLMGGYFAGLVNSDILDATLDHESLRRLNSGLGCGAIAILTDDCPIAVAASVMGLLRPRSGTVRLLFQRHGGDVGCHRGRCVMGSQRTKTWPDWSAGRLCCAAAVLRDPGRRHQRRRQPAGSVSPTGRQSFGKRLQDMPSRRLQCNAPLRGGGGDPGMKVKLDRTLCDGFGLCAKHAPSTFHSTTGDMRRWSETASPPRKTMMRSCVRSWTAPFTRSSKWVDTGRRLHPHTTLTRRPSLTSTPMTVKRSRVSSGDTTSA